MGSGLKLGFLTQEGKPPTDPELKDQRQQTLRLCVRSHHRARPSGTEVDKDSSGTSTSLPGSPWDGFLASSQNQVAQTFGDPRCPWLHVIHTGSAFSGRTGVGLARAWAPEKGRAPEGTCVML